MEENVNSANHDDCAIGIASKSECPKTSHYLCGEIHMKLFGDFDFHQQQLIMRRSGMTVDPKDQICSYHEAALLTKYEFIQKQCCNPFAKTKHAVKKDLRVIDTDIADKLQKMTKNDVKPGQKLCAQCRKDFRTKLQDKSSLNCESDCEHMDVSEKLNSGLVPLGLSPLKFQRVSQMNSRSYAKRKISNVQSVIATGIAVAGGFQSGEFSQASDNKDCQNCTDYAQLIEELKNKMNISNRAQKIQMLTLAPSSWSIAKTAAEFKVSTRMVKHSRKLKVEVGILALPGKKPGKKISDEIKKKVLNFYEDDEFSIDISDTDSEFEVRRGKVTKAKTTGARKPDNVKEHAEPDIVVEPTELNKVKEPAKITNSDSDSDGSDVYVPSFGERVQAKMAGTSLPTKPTTAPRAKKPVAGPKPKAAVTKKTETKRKAPVKKAAPKKPEAAKRKNMSDSEDDIFEQKPSNKKTKSKSGLSSGSESDSDAVVVPREKAGRAKKCVQYNFGSSESEEDF